MTRRGSIAIRVFSILVLIISAQIVIAQNPAAQTWDALRDFKDSNPNGAWSYGWGVTGTSFAPYTSYDPDCAGVFADGFVCWSAEIDDHTPLVGWNTTGTWLNFRTVVYPPNALVIHPAPDWDPGDSIVQWTAPAAAIYRITGYFEILDVSPSGIIVSVYRNGALLFTGELLGPPAQPPDQIGGRVNFYFPQLSLEAGDVISFGVNADGDYHYDSTGFNATIATPPTAPCAACSEQGRSR